MSRQPLLFLTRMHDALCQFKFSLLLADDLALTIPFPRPPSVPRQVAPESLQHGTSRPVKPKALLAPVSQDAITLGISWYFLVLGNLRQFDPH
jgi:hypothetical protein